jgi:GNAT superfamily N-acetyltransferase
MSARTPGPKPDSRSPDPRHSAAAERDEILRLERMEALAWRSFHRAADDETVAGCGLRREELGSISASAASRVDVLAFNRVLGLGLKEPATEGDVDRVLEWYAAVGSRRFFVQLAPGAAPAELPAWLENRGLRSYNNWVKLARGVEETPEVTTDLRVERIGPEQGGEFATIAAQAFDWPDEVRPWIVRSVGRPGWHHYMAYDGSTPVATGSLYVEEGGGWLDFAATVAEHRGRGAQSALLARRIRDAADRGCSFLTVETAQDKPDRRAPSFHNTRRFGFRVAYLRANYIFAG